MRREQMRRRYSAGNEAGPSPPAGAKGDGPSARVCAESIPARAESRKFAWSRASRMRVHSPRARGADSFTRHSAATNPRSTALSPTPANPTNIFTPQGAPPLREHADPPPDREAVARPPLRGTTAGDHSPETREETSPRAQGAVQGE